MDSPARFRTPHVRAFGTATGGGSASLELLDSVLAVRQTRDPNDGNVTRLHAGMSSRSTPRDPVGEPITPPVSTRGIIFGTVLLGLLLFGFAFWANSAAQRVGGSTGSLPELLILEPVGGSALAGRVPLVFQVEADLRRAPAGWSAGSAHLHAAVNGQELMPGATEIEILSRNLYRWTLPALPTGEHTVRLFWSDARHRPIEDGASAPLRIRVR